MKTFPGNENRYDKKRVSNTKVVHKTRKRLAVDLDWKEQSVYEPAREESLAGRVAVRKFNLTGSTLMHPKSGCISPAAPLHASTHTQAHRKRRVCTI